MKITSLFKHVSPSVVSLHGVTAFKKLLAEPAGLRLQNFMKDPLKAARFLEALGNSGNTAEVLLREAFETSTVSTLPKRFFTTPLLSMRAVVVGLAGNGRAADVMDFLRAAPAEEKLSIFKAENAVWGLSLLPRESGAANAMEILSMIKKLPTDQQISLLTDHTSGSAFNALVTSGLSRDIREHLHELQARHKPPVNEPAVA